jgi:hypothetical protein
VRTAGTSVIEKKAMEASLDGRVMELMFRSLGSLTVTNCM